MFVKLKDWPAGTEIVEQVLKEDRHRFLEALVFHHLKDEIPPEAVTLKIELHVSLDIAAPPQQMHVFKVEVPVQEGEPKKEPEES